MMTLCRVRGRAGCTSVRLGSPRSVLKRVLPVETRFDRPSDRSTAATTDLVVYSRLAGARVFLAQDQVPAPTHPPTETCPSPRADFLSESLV
jgi:hypothetical protein